MPLKLCLLLLIHQFAVLVRANAQEDLEELTTFTMCQAGLTSTAAEYAIARRNLVQHDRSLYARWTMHLMECHAQAALRATQNAETAWSDSLNVYAQFIDASPDNPRLPWLHWQRARCLLLRAQQDLASYRAAPANQQPRESALQLIRELLSSLEALQDDIAQRQPLAARQGVGVGEQAPAEQLHQLSVDGTLMQCEGLLVRSRLYPTNSQDRIAAATDVDTLASDLLRRTGAEWPSRDQLRVAQASARLELGQDVEALQQLQQIALNSNHRLARIRAATTAVETLLATNQTSRARALLAVLQADAAGPELELATMQIELTELMNQTAEQKSASLSRLIAAARQLGERYGEYWRRRGEALLTGSSVAQGVAASPDVALELLVVEVRQLLAAGNDQDAIDRLLRFSAQEGVTGRGFNAVKAASQAAALQQRRGDWLAAAETVRRTSIQFSGEPNAAQAHLQAVLAISQVLKSDIGNSELQNIYATLLVEHLQNFPDASTAAEIERWLSDWLGNRQAYGQLAEAYLSRAVATQDTRVFEQSMLAWLGAVLNVVDPAERSLHLSKIDPDTLELKPSETHERILQVVRIAADLLLNWHTADEVAKRLRLLVPPEPPDSTQPLGQLIMACHQLTATGQYQNQASFEISKQDWRPDLLPANLRHAIARALVDAIDESTAVSHAALAKELQLTSQWSGALRQSASLLNQAAGYRILAWLESPSEGLAGLEALCNQASREGGWLQLQLANALADSGANRLEDSDRIAKVLVANSPAGSELQFAARWRIMKNHLLAGRVTAAQQAAQLALAVQVVSPKWRDRFASLLPE
jgi:hypothetical protein